MAFDWRILTALELVWVLVAAGVIVLQRRSATATVAWVLAVALLPVVGFIIYWLIGPQRLKRTKLARVASAQQVAAAMAGLEEAKLSAPEHARLALVPLGLGEAPPLAAHAITPYLDGRSAYAAICAAIEAARHHVHLEYYIWEPDGIGTRLRDLLIAKARAGVEVRMLVDGTGAVSACSAHARHCCVAKPACCKRNNWPKLAITISTRLPMCGPAPPSWMIFSGSMRLTPVPRKAGWP
jgi:cardiolipin synthase